jgi:hypothetical protein
MSLRLVFLKFAQLPALQAHGQVLALKLNEILIFKNLILQH